MLRQERELTTAHGEGKRQRHMYTYTAVYKKSGGHYIAWVEEIPGVNTQGRTKAETQRNLREALLLVLEANRKLSRDNTGISSVREPLRIGIPA